ncbi:hypothetical protein ACQKRQ_37870 [Paraburkholderia sp. NPDC080076]|uniref:hypothetical protein n=1 Tax=Paraburkholderia sp. NPDC080076 TaxID=3390605 RepID=UPI003CFF4481
MKKIWIGILIACGPLLPVSAQDVQGTSITVAVENAKYVFSCDGASGAQSIAVSLLEAHVGDQRLVGPQRLDDADDCSQVTWTTQPASESGAQLVMANPGQLGLNAQMLVYYADKDGVEFSGYLPVAADTLTPGQFRVVGADAYGEWERTYAFKNHKLNVAQELLLVQSGTVCVERSGTVKTNLPCAGSTIKASAKSPVCVIQQDGRATLAASRTCSSLTLRR